MPEAYRPVAILPAVSKLIEKIAQEQITEHMYTGKLWNSNHHTYKFGHSTTTALGQITDLIFEAGDNNLITTTMAIDETAAFDCIEYKILIEKTINIQMQPKYYQMDR